MPNRSKSFRRIAEDAAKEFAGSALTILSIYLLRKPVESLLGKDLLWDIVPLRYCADTVGRDGVHTIYLADREDFR